MRVGAALHFAFLAAAAVGVWAALQQPADPAGPAAAIEPPPAEVAARADAYRAGLQEGIEQGCATAPTLAHPLGRGR